MKQIAILGAGKSSSVMIKHLSQRAEVNDWQLIIGDIDTDAARKRIGELPRTKVIAFDLNDSGSLNKLVESADIVISLLPADFHPLVAECCVEHGKNMVTASYVSDEMKALHDKAVAKGVLLLNEIGVDPGIDHMSAMQVIDRIKAQGGKMDAFESLTGGLLAPESEKDNPWRYKFTWNPRNVVLAGQGMAKFLQQGKYKYIPYNRLFRRYEIIHIPGYDYFEGYANRDSLSYIDLYNLQESKTIYRGTLRRPGFCKTWNTFVQLGATNDEFIMDNTENMTYREFINSFLYYHPSDSVEGKLAAYMNFDREGGEMYRLKWLGLFSDKKVGLKKATPAQVLQKILEDTWTLNPADKDMIVMWHKFNYTLNGNSKELHASMVVTGENTIDTAMAKTVGLPVAIAAEMVLNGTVKLTGVHIPTIKELYQPILKELSNNGIKFEEREIN